jgi:hypothetical protein
VVRRPRCPLSTWVVGQTAVGPTAVGPTVVDATVVDPTVVDPADNQGRRAARASMAFRVARVV